MADPMEALLDFQRALDNETLFNSQDNSYLMFYDEPFEGGRRFSFSKISKKEIQVLSIFGLEDPINEITCYNVGYAVSENHRGKGLALEAVLTGIESLKKKLKEEGLKIFYLEAIVGITNKHSINVAEKIFSSKGIAMPDRESGTPALYFKKIIQIE